MFIKFKVEIGPRLLLVVWLLMALKWAWAAEFGNQIESGHAICSAYGHKLVSAKFGKENHRLCLKLKAIGSLPLTTHESALYLDPEPKKDDVLTFPLADVTMAYGFPVDNPSAGSAEGYIGEDHQFYGVLHLGNRTLHADPYGKDDPKRFFGAFEDDHMSGPRFRRGNFQQMEFLERHLYFPYEIEEQKRAPGVARARICELLLLADKQFYEKEANSSLDHVVRRMLHAVAQADTVFRNADFNEDGIPDNIGFSVKYIFVLTSEDTNIRVFGDLLKDHSVDGRDYLMRFSRLRRLSEVCLGVAFSGHAFNNRTLGLSFTSLGGGLGGAAGGLCDRRAYGRSFNTLAVAHSTANERERVPERIAALTLAHEMGHSFGAHHDNNFPIPECRGFLMSSQPTAETGGTFEFSVCSKRLIAATLSGMGYCLSEEDRPYCGNGIVEEGEACDCGLPSRCSHRDPCCTPRAGGALIHEDGALHKEGCSVSPVAACHPSQGLCCNSNCQYSDLTSSGIDCKSQDQECSCESKNADCRCGLGGRCLDDGSCHAAECALLGLKECECPKDETTGVSGVCKVCCELNNTENKNYRNCVTAEEAARASDISLLDKWPDEDYRGPNITARICKGVTCKIASLRAWPTGGPCVSQNRVGLCSPNGVCKLALPTPRSNIYPDIMTIKSLGLKNYATKNFRRIWKYTTAFIMLIVN